LKRIILFPLVFLVSFATISTLLFEMALKYIDIENLYNVIAFIKPFKSISSFDFFVLVTFFISMMLSLLIIFLLKKNFK